MMFVTSVGWRLASLQSVVYYVLVPTFLSDWETVFVTGDDLFVTMIIERQVLIMY